MKKLKLNALAFQSGEVLTRIQLKNVLGGSDPGSGGGPDCDDECSSAGSECTLKGKTGTCTGYSASSTCGKTTQLLCIIP